MNTWITNEIISKKKYIYYIILLVYLYIISFVSTQTSINIDPHKVLYSQLKLTRLTRSSLGSSKTWTVTGPKTLQLGLELELRLPDCLKLVCCPQPTTSVV